MTSTLRRYRKYTFTATVFLALGILAVGSITGRTVYRTGCDADVVFNEQEFVLVINCREVFFDVSWFEILRVNVDWARTGSASSKPKRVRSFTIVAWKSGAGIQNFYLTDDIAGGGLMCINERPCIINRLSNDSIKGVILNDGMFHPIAEHSITTALDKYGATESFALHGWELVYASPGSIRAETPITLTTSDDKEAVLVVERENKDTNRERVKFIIRELITETILWSETIELFSKDPWEARMIAP